MSSGLNWPFNKPSNSRQLTNGPVCYDGPISVIVQVGHFNYLVTSVRAALLVSPIIITTGLKFLVITNICFINQLIGLQLPSPWCLQLPSPWRSVTIVTCYLDHSKCITSFEGAVNYEGQLVYIYFKQISLGL